MIGVRYLIKSFHEGEFVTFQHKEYVCKLHERIHYIYWLIEGELEYVASLSSNYPEIVVCRFSMPYLPIGWNGLMASGRYTKNISIASETAKFYRVPIQKNFNFSDVLSLDRELAQHICRNQYELLKTAVFWQNRILPNHVFLEPRHEEMRDDVLDESKSDVYSLLKISPFFEQFRDEELSLLMDSFKRRTYYPGETILAQDQPAEGLFILQSGAVKVQRFGDQHAVSQWPIKDKGFIFGWASVLDEEEFCTAQAVTETSVFVTNVALLNRILYDNPDFALRFLSRVSWLIDNHVNAAFVRYLSIYFNYNEVTIKYLIEHYQTQIKLTSNLHKIPHLLSDKKTTSMAVEMLRSLVDAGTSRERRIASISLDLLKGAEQEIKYFHQLEKVYESVAEQPSEITSEEMRKICAEETRTLGKYYHFVIDGFENLPEESGNIIIYNHLQNHSYYTLNNNFHITLDSHFLSAEILDRKYGTPGIRVVRIGKNQEYAHQNYYERLGYINVFTRDSENTTSEARAESRQSFFAEALKYLAAGENLILSPEGRSFATEDDIPGSFKAGAFRLALEAKKEPFIVPIIFLYFDKRINDATKYCKILRPFKITEHEAYLKSKDLNEFILSFHDEFKNELTKAKMETQHYLSNANIPSYD